MLCLHTEFSKRAKETSVESSLVQNNLVSLFYAEGLCLSFLFSIVYINKKNKKIMHKSQEWVIQPTDLATVFLFL